MEFGIACSGEAQGLKAVLVDEEFAQFRGTGGRELSIRRKMCGMNGHVVGVTFDANRFATRAEHRSKTVNSPHGGGTHGGRAALVKSHFTQTND